MADYQVMPPLSAEEYAALKADIAERGVLTPIHVDQHGSIIDGHHRQQIAKELGVPYDRLKGWYADEDEARDAAFTLNLARRHLSRKQRRELIAREVQSRPDDSDRAIARRLQCDHKTVGSVRRELSGEIPQQHREREQRIGFYSVHPFLACFPWVDDETFAGIVDSIEQFGLISPIVLTHDRRTIVDGRIRYRACEAAGVEPHFRVLGSHYTETMILDYIYSANGVRKHVGEGQVAAAHAKFDALMAEAVSAR